MNYIQLMSFNVPLNLLCETIGITKNTAELWRKKIFKTVNEYQNHLVLSGTVFIDEIHNPELSYKHSSYLCVLVDGEGRCVYDVLGSKSKYYLNNYFMQFPLTQRLKVKYVTIDL